MIQQPYIEKISLDENQTLQMHTNYFLEEKFPTHALDRIPNVYSPRDQVGAQFHVPIWMRWFGMLKFGSLVIEENLPFQLSIFRSTSALYHATPQHMFFH